MRFVIALSVISFVVSQSALAQKPAASPARAAATSITSVTAAAATTPAPAATAAPSNATSSATPQASPKPQATSKSVMPTASPAAASADELTKNCALHFPGRIQGELRNACGSATLKFTSSAKGLAQTRCRLNYGEEPRAVMACLIGVSMADDINNQRTDFKRKLQLCADQYPQHTEIDAFLQESCLTGIHLPDLLPALSAQPYESCGQLSPERSFIGPCSVGLSLVNELNSEVGPSQQNKLCEQYFDHKRFHLTYRACLNARSVAVEGSTKVDDVIRDCSNIVSDPGNDNERAACLIGSNIHRSLEKKQDIAKHFGKCGANKVSYQDRDVLACLTAASLVDMVGRGNAENGCKTVFKEAKSTSRVDCLNSLAQPM